MTRRGIELDLGSHAGAVRTVQRILKNRGAEVRDAMSAKLALPEVSTTIGTHQRHQLRVPTAETLDGTVVSVGRRAAGRNFDGYGLTTIAHVAVSAEGGKAESTLTLQSNGQAVLQSDTDSVYVVSKGPAVLASAAVANVVGSGGVVLAAGGSVSVANPAIDGASPPKPGSLDGHAALMTAAKGHWSAVKDAAEGAVSARDALSDAADPDFKTAWEETQAKVEQKDLAAAAHGDRNEAGSETTSEGGGMSLYAEKGLLLGTPGFGALHAEEALTITSKNPALMATEKLDLSAQEDATLTAGGNAFLIAKKKVRVIASEEDLHLATRTGDKLELQAKAVHVGQLEPDDPQEETELVSMRAKKRISLATDDDAGRDEGDDGIYLKTHELIEGKAETTITLEAGETITLKIADKDIFVSVDEGGVISITSDDTFLEISDDDGLVFGDEQDEYLTASSDGVFAGIDSDNCLDISSSSVSLKGNRIEIG